MAIIVNEENRLFTLHTKHTTYQMHAGRYGTMLHLYYGAKIEDDMRFNLRFYDRSFSPNPSETGKDRTYSLDVLPQEYPVFGTGDFRVPALVVEYEDGSAVLDLRYKGYERKEGKYTLSSLPHAHSEKEEAETLILHLEDVCGKVAVDLYYGVFPETDVITRCACIRNLGEEDFYINKAASTSLDFLQAGLEVVHLPGRYGRERIAERVSIPQGVTCFGSERTITSHQENNFLMLTAKGATEESGDCYGAALVYSGSFKNEVERDSIGQLRLVMGLGDTQFSYLVEPQASFTTPEAVMTFSADGMTGVSENMHPFIRKHICQGPYADKRRPVLINNWEATYFDFNLEKLEKIAEQAANLGVELFVLDDGWFGHRENDESSLGDWFVNEEKMGGKIGVLAEKIREKGMKFGIWIEPEMISEDSELYRAHPDYALAYPGRAPVRSRCQLVLDFSREEVVNCIFESISKVLDETRADYVKIDMNRPLVEIYSQGGGYQNHGATGHKYVLGMYRFLQRLRERYPDMLIEGCCGGGGRFDLGMLFYAPQIWCSDNTDAVERLSIQHGTSMCYPMSCVGAHVSTVPNHQTGRRTPLRTRGAVALAGGFGYELDLNTLTAEEKETVKTQIAAYKENWNLISKGSYYRLTAPGEQIYMASEYAGEEGALLTIVMLQNQCNTILPVIRLKGLIPDATYRTEIVPLGEQKIPMLQNVRWNGKEISGEALMKAGLAIPWFSWEEYDTLQIKCVKC